MITLTAADGHQFDCYTIGATGDRRGGIVIAQEIFGITDQLKGVAARYAEKGYEVAIPALFDRKERDAVIPFEEAPRGRDLMLAADLEETMMDIGATVGHLAKMGKVAVIGFCWGGGLAIRAAQVTDGVDCAVAFYGTRLPQYLDRDVRVPVLGHFGRTDDHTPAEVVEDAQAKLSKLTVHWYDAGHAFANDARPSVYNAEAAALAHERTEAFLAEHLG